MKTDQKKYIVLAILAAGLAIAMLQSCSLGCVKGSGHQVTETRKVGDFTKIDISGDFLVNLKQDSSLNLNITADDNLMNYIKTDVNGGKLHIHIRKNICNSGQMTINIGVHKLEELRASGAVEVNTTGTLNAKDITLDLSGDNKLTLDLNADNVTTTGSGVMELNLKGQASSHSVNISGIGRVYALGFVVGDYDIETSGAAHCDINVLKSLSIHSSGTSEVRYKGNPSNITNNKSGASSLEKIN